MVSTWIWISDLTIQGLDVDAVVTNTVKKGCELAQLFAFAVVLPFFPFVLPQSFTVSLRSCLPPVLSQSCPASLLFFLPPFCPVSLLSSFPPVLPLSCPNSLLSSLPPYCLRNVAES